MALTSSAATSAAPQFIKIAGVWSSVKPTYSPDVCANFSDRANYLNSYNTRRVKIEHRLRQRSSDRLYWSFIPNTSRSKLPLPCLRTYYKRRWSNAFQEALKQNGFDSRGRPLSVSSRFSKPSGLTGTLEILLYEAILWDSNDHSVMVQQSDKIVKGLVDHLRPAERPLIRAISI